MEYLKKAKSIPQTLDTNTAEIVRDILANIRERGKEAVVEYSSKLDKYNGRIVATEDDIMKAESQLSQKLKDDIKFAYDRVRKFAEHQRSSLTEFECELSPGLRAGQKLIPVGSAGCYVPGGRYAHIASAVMSITTAKVAGVKYITACSSPKDENGMHPAIMYTMNLCGADLILNLGGVQAIAAMVFNLYGGTPANFIVGPGNRFVAEAKRILFGDVGIDQVAGPTEILVIADDSADPLIVATDLVSQAEHGTDSPAWLISTSKALAERVIELMPGLISKLPESHRLAAEASWRDYGEVVYCSSKEDAAKVSDEYAAEHLELQTADNGWYKDNLRSYGSLFIGEETTVTFGDKCSGPNHILPTRGAAKYTGGLCVQKFMKIVTWQEMTQEANQTVGAAAARISRYEGMEAHARSADARLNKYYPGHGIPLS